MFLPKLVRLVMIVMEFDVSVLIGAGIGVTNHEFDGIQ